MFDFSTHTQTIHVCTHVWHIMTFKGPESSCASKWRINFSKNIDHLKSAVHPQTTLSDKLPRPVLQLTGKRTWLRLWRGSPKVTHQWVGVLGTSKWKSLSPWHWLPALPEDIYLFPGAEHELRLLQVPWVLHLEQMICSLAPLCPAYVLTKSLPQF